MDLITKNNYSKESCLNKLGRSGFFDSPLNRINLLLKSRGVDVVINGMITLPTSWSDAFGINRDVNKGTPQLYTGFTVANADD